MADLDKYLDKIHVQEVEPFVMSLAILGTTAGIINAINLTYRTYKEYLTNEKTLAHASRQLKKMHSLATT